ncbi:MAG: choice-of-anchor Q domain-containing protein [Thermomicrobiales bacterium]
MTRYWGERLGGGAWRALRWIGAGALLAPLLLTLVIVPSVRASATVTANVFTDPAPGACAASGTGNCSLREAVIYANGHADTTIMLPANTYNLTIGCPGAFCSGTNATSGDLNLTNTTGTTTIMGAGAATTIIDGSGMTPTRDRIFAVSAGVTAIMIGVTIRNGQTSDNNVGPFGGNGGGINNLGTLTLNSSTLSNNATLGSFTNNSGGGVYSTGTLTLTSSTISGNTAGTAAIAALGGGIYNFGGTLTITDSMISSNAAPRGSAGGIMNDFGGQATVTNSAITGNTAFDAGGGISNTTPTATPSPMTLTNTLISGNALSDISGNATGSGIFNSTQMTLNTTTVSSNTAPSGVAAFFTNGDVTLNGSAVTGNQRTGIAMNGGTLTLTNSRVSNQTLGGDGVLADGTVMVTGSTISGNAANGVTVRAGTTTLTNSTVSGNASGIENRNGLALLIQATVANNSIGIKADSVTISMKNTLLSNTTNCVGSPITSNDYNLATDTSCNTALTQPHDLKNTPTAIGLLADNDGATTPHTLTHALLPGSPAIDKIPNTGGCNGASVTTDQRGFARPSPSGGLCDIGAFEVQVQPPPNPLPPPQPTAPVVANTPAPLPMVHPTGVPITNATPLPLPIRRP